jgi:hypothetical protein
MVNLCRTIFDLISEMVLICDFEFTQSVSVRLTVSSSTSDAWAWHYILHKDQIIASGKTTSRLAAQVAVQRVHEDWLHRNQKRFNVPRFSLSVERDRVIATTTGFPKRKPLASLSRLSALTHQGILPLLHLLPPLVACSCGKQRPVESGEEFN